MESEIQKEILSMEPKYAFFYITGGISKHMLINNGNQCLAVKVHFPSVRYIQCYIYILFVMISNA
uniref:Uncharacterized protein n=1 Tax=Heterorhabditis bacteriophora TaxID=37862 RepID=A0A1I7X4A8_HETBA